MYNLAPIGMGRASFRLAEIIQLGRIPIYLYEDYPWSPYEGSGIYIRIFIYIYIFVYTYIYTYVCTRMYAYIYIYMNLCIYT
jgi:hypothetical protein